jgi:hypothetical protein
MFLSSGEIRGSLLQLLRGSLMIRDGTHTPTQKIPFFPFSYFLLFDSLLITYYMDHCVYYRCQISDVAHSRLGWERCWCSCAAFDSFCFFNHLLSSFLDAVKGPNAWNCSDVNLVSASGPGFFIYFLRAGQKGIGWMGVPPPPFYFLVSLATSFCFLRFCVLFTRTWKDWLEDDPSWLTFSFAPSLCGPRGGPRFLIRIRDRWDARRPSRISTFVYSVASSELPFWAESKKFDESRRQAAEKNWVYRCRTMPLGYLSTFLGFGWFMTWWGSI